MSVLLVDGKNALYRAAMGAGWLMPGYEGDRGAHVHGFIKSLLRSAREVEGRALVIVVWEGESNWRPAVWPAYKAHRVASALTGAQAAERAEAMAQFEEDQIALRDMLRALGVRQAWPVVGEADDAMATLADRFCHAGVTIWTGDHDLLQCVRPGVRVVTPGKADGTPPRAYETDEDVMEKVGVRAALVPDLKAIAGDPSDGFPGVPGLGPVAARRLLTAHENLEGVIRATAGDEFAGSPRQRELMIKHADEARTFLRLSTLDRAADLRHLAPGHDRDAALAAMHTLGLRAMARQGWFHEIRQALAAPRVEA